MKYELCVIAQSGTMQEFEIEADVVLTSDTEINFYSKNKDDAISIREQSVNGEKNYLTAHFRIGHGHSYTVCKLPS